MTYPIPAPADPLQGDAVLPPDVRVADFWRWAYADLCEDYTKGIFAEWMVGTLLGLPMAERRRFSFANYDFLIADRLRVEVKATSYWQSWRLFDEEGALRPTPIRPTPPSKIRFAGLRARKGAAGNNAASPPQYKADLYVFCLENQDDPARWNPLDLSQWEFYVLGRDVLERLGTKAISLKKLRALSPRMTAREFQERMRSGLSGHAA